MIVKLDQTVMFVDVPIGKPFYATVTLYTRSKGTEDPREYAFFKTGKSKANTVDRKTSVHFLSNELVNKAIKE
mgnify:CR=1 FL=1